MQRMAQWVFVALAVLGIGGFAVLPHVVPREQLAHVSPRAQVADADAAWWGDYQMAFDPADTYDTSDVLGNMTDGYGWAPCMDLGTCEAGSLKDGPVDTYDQYDEYYAPYDTYDTYDTYDYYEPEYSYGSRTGSYVSAGLSQVPLILSNALAPQSYTTYTPSYPQQTVQSYTYAQPQTYTYAQPTYQYQQSGTIAVPAVQQSYQQYIQAPVQATTYQQVGYTQQAAQITGTSYVSVPQVIAQPVQTTRAGFFAAGQPIQQQTQVTVSSSGGSSAPAQPVASCWITAKPTRIAAGATTTLSWKVSNASSATLTPTGIAVPLVGSTTAQLATTTTFTLAVSGDYGTATCTAKVTIDPTMCLPGCPPGYTCTPIASIQAATTTKKSGFWSWFGF